MARYGVGVIGAGWVAGEYLKAFAQHPLTEVVGVHNRTPGKAAQLLRAHGVDAREYGTVDELLGDPRVSIVVSCTPPDARPDHAVLAAESGRHVVLEKPVGLTMEDVLRVRDAVARAGVKTVTSFVLRWNPQFATIRRLLDDGVLGDLLYAEADYWNPSDKSWPCYPWLRTRAVGGSAFLTGGCHAVDALRYLGGEIVEVAAFSAPARRNPEYEWDPNVVATLRFENGAVGKVSAVLDCDTPYVFNVRLFGSTATVQNNRVFSSLHYPGSLDYWEFPTVRPDSADVAHHPFPDEVAHFVECIETDRESHASIHDTWRTMAAVFAIEESLAAGGAPVRVGEVAARTAAMR
jgi:UDP-N-acetyl-2-amino-2-deoxyglucuronate dehydrogenase